MSINIDLSVTTFSQLADRKIFWKFVWKNPLWSVLTVYQLKFICSICQPARNQSEQILIRADYWVPPIYINIWCLNSFNSQICFLNIWNYWKWFHASLLWHMLMDCAQCIEEKSWVDKVFYQSIQGIHTTD